MAQNTNVWICFMLVWRWHIPQAIRIPCYRAVTFLS